MGNKNRIYLAVIKNHILHILRNIFSSKEVYITKAKYMKIQQKHPEVFYYLTENNFQTIIDNTIGICDYKCDTTLINFISLVNNEIFLYSLSPQNNFTYIGTFFKSDKRKILKQCTHEIKFINNESKRKFEEYM